VLYDKSNKLDNAKQEKAIIPDIIYSFFTALLRCSLAALPHGCLFE
jgi:hypothetical protein